MNQPDDETTTREHTRRILQASRIPEIWREMNQALLKGRGWYDEYSGGVLLKWGTGYTRRHIWIDVQDEVIRFRLLQHRPCAPTLTPLACDGEYHAMNRAQWSDLAFLKEQMKYYYDHAVAESSDD